MSIFLTETDRVIVQGMTGSEGRKHTTRTNLAHKPTLGINHLSGHPPAILGHQPRNQTRRIIRQTPSAEREQGRKRLPHAVGHIRIRIHRPRIYAIHRKPARGQLVRNRLCDAR